MNIRIFSLFQFIFSLLHILTFKRYSRFFFPVCLFFRQCSNNTEFLTALTPAGLWPVYTLPSWALPSLDTPRNQCTTLRNFCGAQLSAQTDVFVMMTKVYLDSTPGAPLRGNTPHVLWCRASVSVLLAWYIHNQVFPCSNSSPPEILFCIKVFWLCLSLSILNIAFIYVSRVHGKRKVKNNDPSFKKIG